VQLKKHDFLVAILAGINAKDTKVKTTIRQVVDVILDL